jgi:hypothetical protein
VVDFFKGDNMLTAYQFLDESFQHFADKVPYTAISRSSEHTACLGKFFIKHVDQPLSVLDTMCELSTCRTRK